MTGFFGGAPALSWSKTKVGGGWEDDETLKGVPLGGRVIAVGEAAQQTKIGTGEPLWWREPNPATGAKGDPKMQIAVTLRCNGECSIQAIAHLVRDLRNPSNPTDTGDRVLYVPDFGDLNKAIKSAFVLAGDDDLRVGAELFVAWLGYRESKMKGAHPARTFAAQYVQRPSGMAVPAGEQPGSPVTGATFETGSSLPAGPVASGPGIAPNPFGGPSQNAVAPAAAPGVAPNPFG